MMSRYGLVMHLNLWDRCSPPGCYSKILQNWLEADDFYLGKMAVQQQECITDIGSNVDDGLNLLRSTTFDESSYCRKLVETYLIACLVQLLGIIDILITRGLSQTLA